MKLVQKLVIVALFTAIIGGAILYQKYFEEKEPVFTKGYDQFLNYTFYINYGNNQYLVDNWTLRYYHTNWTEPVIWYEYGPFSVVFDAPEDNMTVKLSCKQFVPENPDFVFPLVVYSGDAYSVESEPLWLQNVSCSELPDIFLESKGVYTICLTGHVMKSGHRYSLKSGDDNFETVLVYVSFQLFDKNGEITKYKIDNSLWGRD